MGHKKGMRRRFNNLAETVYQGEQKYGRPAFKGYQYVGAGVAMVPGLQAEGLALEGIGIVGEQTLKLQKSVHDGKSPNINMGKVTKGVGKIFFCLISF